ncbi:acyltransferase [Helicobacter bilis]|uniref:acyltransferase n=1 Tax=Helicobacter bilis TaxID=37372 RepID=UPI001EE8BCC2|nr:acetyltransferase [Helicobacter bilis]
MSYLTQHELLSLDFKSLGKNVLISSKASLYDTHLMILDDNVRIDDFCVISGNVYLGKSVSIAPFCLIAGGSKSEDLQKGGVIIGDHSVFAYGVRAFSRSDNYVTTNKDEVYIDRVVIGHHCICGTNSVIYAGSRLGDYVSVGALSFVKGVCEDYSVYVGTPAKLLKRVKLYGGGGGKYLYFILFCLCVYRKIFTFKSLQLFTQCKFLFPSYISKIQ